MKSLASVALLGLLALTGCGGGGDGGEGAVPQIKTESLEKTGDTWKVSFTSEVAAPVDKVFEALTQPEKGHEMLPDNILKSDLLSSEGNKKVIDLVLKLDILPPGFKVQNPRNEFTFFPAEKRATSQTIDFKLADIASEFRLKPTADGKGTIIEFSQTSKDKSSMIVESLQKGALRETYVIQVKAIEKALGLDTGDPAKAG